MTEERGERKKKGVREQQGKSGLDSKEGHEEIQKSLRKVKTLVRVVVGSGNKTTELHVPGSCTMSKRSYIPLEEDKRVNVKKTRMVACELYTLQ